MASSEERPETLALQEHFTELLQSLQDPYSVAEILYSKGFVSIQRLQEIGNFNLTTTQKCRALVQDVLFTVVFRHIPAVFEVFTDALDEVQPSSSLASKLRISFGTYVCSS